MKAILFTKDESICLKSVLRLQRAELVLDFEKNKKKIEQYEKLIRKLERAEKKIKTSSAKAKGRNLQYWVCCKIADFFHIEFNQQEDECLIHSREMGQHNVDIILRGYVKKQFPFSIECKNQETISIKDWIKQAKTNEQENNYWMLIFKNKEIKNPVVCLDFETFLKFYRMQL